MFDGRDIDDLRKSVCSNFYTDADIDIIQEASLPDKRDIKRLMNKADKIGDIETVFALEEIYADILNPPDRVCGDICNGWLLVYTGFNLCQGF